MRMIYTSSYDRGIENLLEVWGDIKKEVPEAELHLFYGWDTFDKIQAENPKMLKFKDYMVKLMHQDGVFEHGRVGHKQLNKEFAKSKFWVYPCHFPEISCISAMKAQAMGCVPITTNYAALSETVKDGVVVEGIGNDEDIKVSYKDAVIKALKEQPTVSIKKEQFGWDKVAKQWEECFNK
jgi:glycosyltransferase involved in cell wall biosynthesis